MLIVDVRVVVAVGVEVILDNEVLVVVRGVFACFEYSRSSFSLFVPNMGAVFDVKLISFYDNFFFQTIFQRSLFARRRLHKDKFTCCTIPEQNQSN